MKAKIDKNKLQPLVKVGLTTHEAACYLELWERGSASVKSVAESIEVLSNATYRLLRSLEKKGFVVALNTSPKTFQAVPPPVAVDSYLEQKKQDLEKAKVESISSLFKETKTSAKTRIDKLTGRDATYKKYIELANKTKKELLVISIGEPVPDDIKIVAVRAKERGVIQRYIFHQYSDENKNLYQSWLRMGVEVRHYQDAGYHLMIFDSTKCILVTSNPENTEERTGLVIYSENLTRALREYFYSLWEKALVVEIK